MSFTANMSNSGITLFFSVSGHFGGVETTWKKKVLVTGCLRHQTSTGKKIRLSEKTSCAELHMYIPLHSQTKKINKKTPPKTNATENNRKWREGSVLVCVFVCLQQSSDISVTSLSILLALCPVFMCFLTYTNPDDFLVFKPGKTEGAKHVRNHLGYEFFPREPKHWDT